MAGNSTSLRCATWAAIVVLALACFKIPGGPGWLSADGVEAVRTDATPSGAQWVHDRRMANPNARRIEPVSALIRAGDGP
jgi:hypothetical protein